jgi:hypothetical protein
MTPNPINTPMCAWHSTATSVEAGTVSALAAAEVIIAISLYWVFAIQFQTQTHLWISIVVAPLLLLRSDASIALGVKCFEQYIDDTFAFGLLPKEKSRSGRFWVALILALTATTFSAYSLARLWLQGLDDAATILLSLTIGYSATQIGLAIDVAGSAKALAAVAERKADTAIAGAMITAATALGVSASGANTVAVISAALATSMLALIGVLRGPATLAAAVDRVRNEMRGDTRGIAIMRAAIETAPLAIAAFAPGFYFGGWIRSVATRITATVRHLWSGAVAMPDNWWRTLFVVDLLYPPELIPGYTRSDFFTISYFTERIKQSENIIEQFICSGALVILYAPAYLYRLSIKSTCWFYFPLVYIMRAPWYAAKPALLGDILWRDPREWWRRFLALLTVCGVVASNLTSLTGIRHSLPAVVVSPLEYVFLIDLAAVKPWQWFNLASAAITIVIFAYIGQFRIIIHHATKDETLKKTVGNYALWLEYAVRLRNVSTGFFFLIATVHALLWLSPIQDHLPGYILKLLHTFYGSAMR